MDCAATSGTTKGLIVGLAPAATDTGDRPIPKDAQGNYTFAFWVSPNIRLVPVDQVTTWQDPAHWNGNDLTVEQVDTITQYKLMVRLRNSGTRTLKRLTMQGWVSSLNAAGPGPDFAILADPDQPFDPQRNPQISFTTDLSMSASEVKPQDPANPDNPANMAVLVSKETWQPNAKQLARNGGHVCLILNVYAQATPGEEGSGTPGDGDAFIGTYIQPYCDRRQGQRNLNIIARPAGTTATRTVMVGVPRTDRCPLEAEVALKQLVVQQGAADLVTLAAKAGLPEHHCPPEDTPFDAVTIDDNGDPSHELGIVLQPGQQRDVVVTVAPYDNEKPGDVYAFDLVTTTESDHSIYGAARFYVMVTAPSGGQ